MPNVHVNYGVPTILIRDILQSTKLRETEAPSVKGSWFSFKNMYFRAVHARGVVTKSKLFGDTWKITIDDGTGAIFCSYKLPEELKEMYEHNRRMLQELQTTEPGDFDDTAALILCRSNVQAFQKFDGEFKLGETLEIAGNLSEYDGNKYVFIWKLSRDKLNDIDVDVEYFRKIDDFYAELDRMR